jgi:iron(III) transport system permease protein
MMKVHPELEEAAQVAGVSTLRNFFYIYLPLIKAGVLAAWFWVMVHSFRELTIALMLSGSGNRTAAVVIFDLWSTGRFTQLAAFGVVMFLILIALIGLSHLLSKRFGVQEAE